MRMNICMNYIYMHGGSTLHAVLRFCGAVGWHSLDYDYGPEVRSKHGSPGYRIFSG